MTMPPCMGTLVKTAPGAEAHPELAARARLAAELVARQLALDAAVPAE